jgi:hypothetical protein
MPPKHKVTLFKVNYRKYLYLRKNLHSTYTRIVYNIFVTPYKIKNKKKIKKTDEVVRTY